MNTVKTIETIMDFQINLSQTLVSDRGIRKLAYIIKYYLPELKSLDLITRTLYHFLANFPSTSHPLKKGRSFCSQNVVYFISKAIKKKHTLIYFD